MPDEIIRALYAALKDVFGDEYEVYTEGVFINAEKPCFFVQCEKTEKIPLLGARYILRTHTLVTLEDDRDTKMREADRITGEIFDAMAWLECPSGLFRARGLNARREDGKLSIRASYDTFLKEKNKNAAPEEDVGMMETLERKR